MEAYADEAGNVKKDIFQTPKWEFFVNFLLTQLDCVCFALSWCIAINLAVCRAILFFIIDVYRKDRQPSPKEAIGLNKDLKPDDDDTSKDGKPSEGERSAGHGKVLLKRDSGLGLSSSLDSTDSGSPVHHDSASNVAEAKVLSVVAEAK